MPRRGSDEHLCVRKHMLALGWCAKSPVSACAPDASGPDSGPDSTVDSDSDFDFDSDSNAHADAHADAERSSSSTSPPSVAAGAPVWLEKRRPSSHGRLSVTFSSPAIIIALPMQQMDSITTEELEVIARRTRKRARALSKEVDTVRAVTMQPASSIAIFSKRVALRHDQDQPHR